MPVTSYSRTPSSNDAAPPNGAPEGMAPGGVNDTIRQIMTDIVNEAVNGAAQLLASVAGTNTITASCTPDITAYATGMLLKFMPANNNTGATTINIDSLGAKSITKFDGTALASGDIQASTMHLILYDGTNFVLLNPNSTAFYDATTANFTGTLQYGGIEVGYRGLPSRTISANDNTAASDNGKAILCDGSGGYTFTIDSDFGVAGNILTIFNASSGNVSVAESLSGAMLWFNGSGSFSTGTRTIASAGIVTVWMVSSTAAYIWGTGLS